MPLSTRSRAVAVVVAVVAAVTTAVQPASAATGDGSPTDSNIRYLGRWDTRSSSTYVSEWAGAYAVLGFTGTTVKLRQRNSVDLYTGLGLLPLPGQRCGDQPRHQRHWARRLQLPVPDRVHHAAGADPREVPERHHLRVGDLPQVVRQRDQGRGRRPHQGR